MIHSRFTRVLGWLLIAWVFVSAQPLAAEPASPAKAARYAPGEVLVRLRDNVPPTALRAWLKTIEGHTEKELLPGLYRVHVPTGRERAAVRALAARPEVMAASPNYLITEPVNVATSLAKAAQIPPEFHPQPVQASSCVITDTLHMSLTPGGAPLPEATLPSSASEVYVVFNYEECVQQRVRVQVYWVDRVPPEIVYTQTVLLNGSDVASILVPAWEYFPERIFPIGQYLTLLQMPPDEAPNSGWSPVASDAWHVSTRPSDFWFLSRSNYQWPLHNTGHWGTPGADIDAPEAWDITTGWNGITIAIVSTGVSMDHETSSTRSGSTKTRFPATVWMTTETGMWTTSTATISPATTSTTQRTRTPIPAIRSVTGPSPPASPLRRRTTRRESLAFPGTHASCR